MTCDHCNRPHNDIRQVYRLNPRNLRPTYQRLCLPCRKTNQQWALVLHDRPYAEAGSRMGGRPW